MRMIVSKKRGASFAAALVSVCAALPASAQETVTEYVPQDKIKQVEDEKRQGWDGTLGVSATVNVVSNDNVVGQTDGVSMLLGLGLVAGLDYIHQRHEIRNTLKVAESLARTPVLDQFTKSDDALELESLYSYFLLKWFGGFGRLSIETALFKSDQISAEPTEYAIKRPDGTVDSNITSRLPLADSLQPFTFRQSIGVFAEPVQTEPFNLSTRLGFGLRETWAQGVYVVTDDSATPAVVEVTDITNPDSDLTIFQGGLEGFVGVGGKFQGKRINYDVGATVLVPFLNNDPQDRSAGDLTRFGLAGNVGFAVFEWMSINYKLSVLRDPQLLDEIQLQNNLLLTFNYTFVERTEPKAPPEPSQAEKDAVEAKQRAEEAEKRAAEAEARAAELEKKLAAESAPAPSPEPEPTPEPTPEP